ncbi:hypothetical protein ABZP36_008834 [Zizania latifolia]
MRAGGGAVQQALAAEAAAVVRQAVTLARRRGHAQVTPLHVASAMLSAAGLLRTACLQSHSHPLQCKALELCFNVALNRLPTAGPAAAMFHHHGGGGGGGHHPPPALSNALVAAFKRAQANQRRGSVEGQQPQQQPPPSPVLAAKVELEQLIISILDDPSVSRVMREAGFSSSQVKANVEKTVASLDQSNTASGGHASSPNSGHGRPKESSKARIDDDAMRVLDCMASGKKRSVVVVGEGAAPAEAVVKAVMDRVSKGELHHRHECLKNLQFVALSVESFQGTSREEVEAKAGDLRALVREGCAAGKGVVLVLQDLAYAAEAWAAASEKRRYDGSGGAPYGQSYCPVEHAVMEVSSLVAGGGRGLERFWVLGFGSYPVYMKCRAGQPPLEAVWDLHPVVVPDGGLALSLSCNEGQASQAQSEPRIGWPFVNGAAGRSELTCSVETVTAASPSIPSWLRRYQDPDHTTPPVSCGTGLQLQSHRWSPSMSNNGSAAHHTSELTLSFTSPVIASSIPGFTYGYNTNTMSSKPWPIHRNDGHTMAMAYHDQPLLRTNPSPESNSVSSSSDGHEQKRPKFTELNAENLKILCNALESNVPRHRSIVPDIASVVLQCRSGMKKRSLSHQEKATSSTTWLLFHGRDCDGKKAMAQELAKLIFGSYTELTSISLDEFSLAYSDSSSGELTLKRQRSPDDNEHNYARRLCETVRQNPHQVIVIDDIEQLDRDSEISIKKAIANGRIRGCNGEEINFEDAIIVLSCDEESDPRSRASSPRVKQRVMSSNGDEEGGRMEKGENSPQCFSLDLNACLEDEEEEEHNFLHNNGVGIHDMVDGVFFFGLMADL